MWDMDMGMGENDSPAAMDDFPPNMIESYQILVVLGTPILNP